jgi:hypothetical protein
VHVTYLRDRHQFPVTYSAAEMAFINLLGRSCEN